MNFVNAIFLPMAAHALLVFILYGLLFVRRKQTILSREAAITYRDGGGEPELSAKVNRNLANQFEAPVLFHAACIVLYLLDADNLATLGLAWFFVASRYAHTYVHVTSNRLSLRAPLFAVGLLSLAILWLWIIAFIVLS